MFDDADELVRVAVGIVRKDDKVLICQRGINRRYGMKWEFPGGKSFPGETLEECLARELEEELDIALTKLKELKTIQATYSDGGNFLITFFLVLEYTGEIKNNVFEDIKWVTPEKAAGYEMLEGSLPILPHLK